jgi:hypothetical protein
LPRARHTVSTDTQAEVRQAGGHVARHGRRRRGGHVACGGLAGQALKALGGQTGSQSVAAAALCTPDPDLAGRTMVAHANVHPSLHLHPYLATGLPAAPA